jgi:hypothetical protein
VRSPTYWGSPYLPYTSQTECLKLKTSMLQDWVQHRTGRSFGKGHRRTVQLARDREPDAGRW